MRNLFFEIDKDDKIGQERLENLKKYTYGYTRFLDLYFAHDLFALYVVSKEIDFDDLRYLVDYYCYESARDYYDEEFVFKAIEFRKMRESGHIDADYDDINYLNNLADELCGIQEMANFKAKSSEIKDEMQQLEEKKKAQEGIIDSHERSLGSSLRVIQKNKNEALALANQKENLNSYIMEKLEKLERSVKENNGALTSKDIYSNLKEAFRISAFVPKYGFKALTFPTKIVLGEVVISGIFSAIIIGVYGFVGVLILLMLMLISGMFLLLPLKEDKLKYYDANWLSELRREYLKKIEPKEKSLIANLSQSKSYLEVAEDCESKIDNIDEKLKYLLEVYNYYEKKYEEVAEKVEIAHLKMEIIFGKLECGINENSDLFDLLDNEKEDRGKTLKKVRRPKRLGGN